MTVPHCPAAAFATLLPDTYDPAVVQRRDWEAYGAFVVGQVILQQRIKSDEYDAESFVPLAGVYLKRYVPANVYPKLLQRLLAAGVLEWAEGGSYHFVPRKPGGQKAKGRSRCYRLGERYRDAPLRPCHLAHPEFLRKVATAWERARAELGPTHQRLFDWYERVEVLPDAPAVPHLALARLRGVGRWFEVDDQGRVHTCVTAMPVHLRQYLRVDGREMAMTDIRNSQPLLLAILIQLLNSSPSTITPDVQLDDLIPSTPTPLVLNEA